MGGWGGSGLLGFMAGRLSIACNCRCSNGLWRPDVSINIAVQIYAANDIVGVSPDLIVLEERKHVHDVYADASSFLREAEQLENFYQPYEFQCELACIGFKIRSHTRFNIVGILELIGFNPKHHPKGIQ